MKLVSCRSSDYYYITEELKGQCYVKSAFFGLYIMIYMMLLFHLQKQKVFDSLMHVLEVL